METFHIWLTIATVFILLELVIPGGIIVFLGLSAASVGGLVYFGILTGVINSLISWFILSILFIIFLRAFFMKYFEGDTTIQNVDEAIDIKGTVVEVTQDILPYKDGRVKFHDSSWQARSNTKISTGERARVQSQEGNCLIVVSMKNNLD